MEKLKIFLLGLFTHLDVLKLFQRTECLLTFAQNTSGSLHETKRNNKFIQNTQWVLAIHLEMIEYLLMTLVIKTPYYIYAPQRKTGKHRKIYWPSKLVKNLFAMGTGKYFHHKNGVETIMTIRN